MMATLHLKKLMADRPLQGLLYAVTSLKLFTLSLNYIRVPAVTPVYRAWSDSRESRAAAGPLESVVLLECPDPAGCRSPAGTPESGARTGFDLTLNQGSCDVEFPFANPPWDCGAWKPGR